MKKLLLLGIAVMVGAASWADSRSAQQMLRIAQQRLGTKVTEATSTVNGAKGSVSAPQAFVTFNADNGNGFVIVGADDRLPEVLGYSNTGSLNEENICPPLKDALAKLSSRLPYMTETYKAGIRTYIPVDTLIATEWSQRAPYNNFCPTFTDTYNRLDTTVTGCTTTALAQVVNYWGQQGLFPSVGDGVNHWKSIGSTGKTEEADIVLNREYDFSTPLDFPSIQNYYGKTTFGDHKVYIPYTKEQGDAVAQLMLACGALAQVNYGPQSGAWHTYLDRVEKYYKGFGKASRIIVRQNYTTEEWMDIISQQLQKHHPLPFTAYTNDAGAGHAFVLDGIDADGNVHINWGWAGQSNAWFNIDYLYPNMQGVGGAEILEAFSFRTSIIVDFAPESFESKPISEYRCHDMGFDVENQAFVFHKFTTYSHARKECKIAIVATNDATGKDTTFLVPDEMALKMIPDTVTRIPFIFEGRDTIVPVNFAGCPDGRYSMKAMTQDPGQEGWSLVRTPWNLRQYAYVNVKDGKVTEVLDDTVKVAVTATLQPVTKILRKGSGAKFSINVKNNSNIETREIMTCVRLNKKDDPKKTCLGCMSTTLAPGGSTTITATTSAIPEAGEYYAYVFAEQADTTEITLSDTIFVTVDEAILDTTTKVAYWGDYYDQTPFVNNYDFPIIFSSHAASDMDKLYVCVRLRDLPDQAIIYEDSVLFSNVKAKDTIGYTFVASHEVLLPGTYLMEICVGNRADGDTLRIGDDINDRFIPASYFTGYAFKVVAPTSVNQVSVAEDKNYAIRKRLVNGRVVITRDDRQYNATGQRLK